MATDNPPHVANYLIIKISICMLLLLGALTVVIPPITFYFAKSTVYPPGSLAGFIHTPIHLDDDPMITLRAGKGIVDFGFPSINQYPKAQPSTSYLLPYLYATLHAFLPGSLSVWGYSAIIFLAGVFSLFLIVFISSDLLLGSIISFSLLLTSTFRAYALTGWDNIAQAFPLALACFLLIRSYSRGMHSITAVVIGLLCSFSLLIRPDAGIIVVGILSAYTILELRAKVLSYIRRLTFAFLGFILPTLTYLLWNYSVFGWITPTTSRLKANISLLGATRYFLVHAVTGYSAMSILLVLVIALLFSRVRPPVWIKPVLLSVLLTGVYAFLVSDFFPAYRMVWSSSVVMGILLSSRFGQDISPRLPSFLRRERMAFFIALLVVIVLAFPSSIKSKIQESRISSPSASSGRPAPASDLANIYPLAQWINSNLDPEQGPLGWFYLGMSYHLPNFDVADFLGKADEVIARMKPINQVIGHNKYDFSSSFNRLKPQAFVHPWGDLANYGYNQESFSKAMLRLSGQKDSYYALSLTTAEVSTRYDICKVLDHDAPASEWALVIRKDIVNQLGERRGDLRCVSLELIRQIASTDPTETSPGSADSQ